MEDNPTLEVYKIIPAVDEEGIWGMSNSDMSFEKRTDVVVNGYQIVK